MRFEKGDTVKFNKSGREYYIPYDSFGVVLNANEYGGGVPFYTVMFHLASGSSTFTVEEGDIRAVEVEFGQTVEAQIPSQALANVCLALWSVSLVVQPMSNVVISGDKMAIYGSDGVPLVEYTLVELEL